MTAARRRERDRNRARRARRREERERAVAAATEATEAMALAREARSARLGSFVEMYGAACAGKGARCRTALRPRGARATGWRRARGAHTFCDARVALRMARGLLSDGRQRGGCGVADRGDAGCRLTCASDVLRLDIWRTVKASRRVPETGRSTCTTSSAARAIRPTDPDGSRTRSTRAARWCRRVRCRNSGTTRRARITTD